MLVLYFLPDRIALLNCVCLFNRYYGIFVQWNRLNFELDLKDISPYFCPEPSGLLLDICFFIFVILLISLTSFLLFVLLLTERFDSNTKIAKTTCFKGTITFHIEI